jgi:serine/threonine-protein kinase RsbW
MPQKLRIGNDLDSLSEMSQWVNATSKALGFSQRLCFHLDLVANEAVTNAISYGYPEGRRGEIELRLREADRHAVLEIEDDGLPFNPLNLAELPLAKSLDDSHIGGLGLVLIRKSMGHCEYQRRDGRNVLILKSPIVSGLAQDT